MPFLRQLYKQKPSAWGPVSAVQASIFKNAERIGIDPGKIQACFPFWENTGMVAINYAANLPAIMPFSNAGSWDAGGLSFIANAGYYVRTGATSEYDLPTPYLTVFARIKRNIESTAWGRIFGKSSPGYLFGVRNAGELLYYTNGTYKYSGYSSGTGVQDSVAYTINNGVHSLYGAGTKRGSFSSANPTNSSAPVDIGVNSGTTFYIVTVINQTLSDSQIAYLSDNPYFLLHRVQPVFYSVPGGAITIKTIIDTVSCLDEIVQISNIFALSDIGTCLDGFSGLIAGLSVLDAGSGVDTVKPIASLTVQDTGAAIDLINQISAVCSVADTGAGIDSVGQLLASMIVSDAGSGADVITVLKELLKTVTDSGTGTDSISRILASLSVSDTGSSTDTISQILAGVSVSDTGTGVDFIALLKDILKTISDTGSGSDSVSIQPVSVSVQDAGTALDLIGHIAVALSVSDASTIAEIISTIKTKLVNVTDAVAGYDSEPTISVSVTVSDAAVALDVIGQVINALAVYDIGSGLDRITKTDFDILPSGKVMVTFTIKTPGASFAMRTPKATFNIE